MNSCLGLFLFLSIIVASAADSLLYNDTQAGQLNITEESEPTTNSSFSMVVVNSSDVLIVNISNSSNLENEANITTTPLIATNVLLVNQSGVQEEIDSPGVVEQVKDIISSSFNTVSHWALAIVGKVKRVVEQSEQSTYNSSLLNNQSIDILPPFNNFTTNATVIQISISNSTNITEGILK
uniref:Uncharacterized protein n=1 Tax=Ditylenchus dipsaci TaxID=166011 RepID=A0A915DCE1_9BILA